VASVCCLYGILQGGRVGSREGDNRVDCSCVGCRGGRGGRPWTPRWVAMYQNFAGKLREVFREHLPPPFARPHRWHGSREAVSTLPV
jgi:hypothetical protein